ncbi:RILP-like protein homolog isoform X2 [Coccinella septempunctata]|uniref:RILP-like protein homolog isoform X2 n=1 Tax=Coccinella septempunctata TaxID=41139 RepID=UPI001D05FF16|nr:RILP-like protein homolog isoform X2 [Coccinella septempunctata]
MPRLKYSTYRDNMDDTRDSFSDNISVVDVYDIASDIGKECEKIIDLYGATAVTGLMPRVITALELLEQLATRNETENAQLLELQTKVSLLENDKIEKAEYRAKFERDLESIEEQWRKDSNDLYNAIAKLQEENRRLLRVQNSTTPNDKENEIETSENPANGEILQQMKDTIEKQRDEIRSKDRQIQEKINEIENMRSNYERIQASTRDAKRKHKNLQTQVRNLCEERADFLVQIQDQQRSINGLKQRLGLAEKENEDLSKMDLPLPSNVAIYDLDDPNRPRFTTEELKDILNERNDLKARVSDLEDELDTYRPKPKPESPIEDDAPVQGPIPLEPDDAPWKKSESGIRKLFCSFRRRGKRKKCFLGRSFDSLNRVRQNYLDKLTVFGSYLPKGAAAVEVFQDVACHLSRRCLSQLLMTQYPSNGPNAANSTLFYIDLTGDVWFS